jgi:histidyl-tRNA synthetase
VARRYGFEEYDGPPLEPLELYTQKSGAEIVGQLYHFTDKGKREVALRPEMTPTLARMVGARAQALKKPIRWFSIPQLFRYERQQRGRLREHFQLNMDIIGETGALADAELIAAAIDVLRAFGLGPNDFKAHVSDRRILRAVIDSYLAPYRRDFEQAERPYDGQIEVAYRWIDKVEKVPSADRELHRQKLVKELQHVWTHGTGQQGRPLVPEETVSRILSVGELNSQDALRNGLAQGEGDTQQADGLFECVAALESMGLSDFIQVDLSIVRGLAYYTGIVFEFFDTSKSLRAICGGGRYDGLLKALGGADLPALGFGMGDVVLGELLKEHRVRISASGSLDAFLVAVGGDDLPTLLKLAHDLRDQGVAVEYALKPQAIRKQLELAASRGATRAVIIGPEERESRVAVVKDLAGGVETRAPFGELAGLLGGR